MPVWTNPYPKHQNTRKWLCSFLKICNVDELYFESGGINSYPRTASVSYCQPSDVHNGLCWSTIAALHIGAGPTTRLGKGYVTWKQPLLAAPPPTSLSWWGPSGKLLVDQLVEHPHSWVMLHGSSWLFWVYHHACNGHSGPHSDSGHPHM